MKWCQQTCGGLPGWFRMETTIDVLSQLLAGTSWLPIIRNRVELSGSSSIFSATFFSPYSSQAISPAIAAEFHSPLTRRAASAFAADSHFLHHGPVGIQPFTALRQRLSMGINARDFFLAGILPDQEVLMDSQHHLTTNTHR